MQAIIDSTFWKRLEMFVANVEVRDMMSEEEKEYILNICLVNIEEEKKSIENAGSRSPLSGNAGNYWKVLKNRLSKDGSETVTNCNRLKMQELMVV